MNAIASPERVASMFRYCPETGRITMRVNTTRRKVGDVASTVRRGGYLAVTIDGRLYQAARVCWALHYGEWPNGMVDHANCDPGDNRIDNLRVATASQNNANRVVSGRKYVLPKGVMPGKAGRFRAQISIDGRCRYLGTFDTSEAAHKAYMAAAQRHYGQFARAA